MAWFFLALAAAGLQASSDVLNKFTLGKASVYALSWATFAFSFLMLAPLSIVQGVPVLGDAFLPALLAVGLLDTIGVLLYMRAIKSSDLSLTLPIQMFTPILMLGTTPIMTGDYASFAGFFGVVMIVVGSYVLNAAQSEKGFFAPFRALVSERGPRLYLLPLK